MEQIKEAFYKVKQDIELLKKEISNLNQGLVETRKSLIEVCEILKEYSYKYKENKSSPPTDSIPTHSSISSTSLIGNPTHNLSQSLPDTQNLGISIGNEGVPTDKQTDKQTNQQTDKSSYNPENTPKKTRESISENSIDNAIQILESLDNLKKELRLKFKRLTDQELLVFSTLYQSSEEEGYTDYKNLSEKLKLTESSIRDYIGRLIKKGIPVEKVKINNKMIRLSISPNLKKVASLSTILQLRSI
jgi:DNA-binding MarR family transcriptional regulator